MKVIAQKMLEAGVSKEQVARMLHNDRRTLGIIYKEVTPEDLRKLVYESNLRDYGDELGPKIKKLIEDGKSWDQIIESSSKPGGRDIPGTR